MSNNQVFEEYEREWRNPNESNPCFCRDESD